MTTPLYCGIDLHSNNSVISIQDKSSKQVYEKRLLNDLPTILKALKPYQQDLQGCVVESTYNWYWLVDDLMEARFLAHLLSLDILPTGYTFTPKQRAV